MSQQKNNLQEWVESLDCLEHFNGQQLLNGNLVNRILKKVLKGYTKQVSSSNSMLNRVSNWNLLIEQLKNIGINISQQNKNKIVNGNQDLVVEVIIQIKQFHLKKEKQNQVDISQIDPKKHPQDTHSLLQLLIVLIIKNMHFGPKQAIALLSNQSTYLAHLLTKGLKGQFKPIDRFLTQLGQNIQKIVFFCKNTDNIVFFLRSIKPALISKSVNVSLNCLNFFSQYLNNYQSEQKITIFKEHLVSTYILAIKRHPQLEMLIIQSVIEICRQKDQFFQILINTYDNPHDREKIFFSIINFFKQNSNLSSLSEFQGFREKLKQTIKNIENEKLSNICIDTISILYSQLPEMFINQQMGNLIIQNIQKTSSFSIKIQIILIHQLFGLLEIFGTSKHFIAPNLYKYLIKFYQKTHEKELKPLLIQNFANIIDIFPSIPATMIFDTIITKKQENQEQISEIQLTFFLKLLQNESLDLKKTLVIYDITSKLFMENFVFAGLAVKILVKIIDNYKQQQITQELTVKLVKISLAIHFANFKKLSHKRRSLTGQTKLNDEEVMAKIKNNAIQFLILKIASLSVVEINQKIQPLVAFSYISMKERPQHLKGIKKILNVLGNFQQIISKYQAQIRHAQQQAKEVKQKEKNSKIKQSRYVNEPEDFDSPIKGQIVNSSNITRKFQTNSLYQSRLLGMSYVGVTPSAQKGIEKYQKVYLQKIQKQDLEKIRKIQQQEKFQQLKKLYKKKMLSQGIEIKGEQNEIRYIFQFDSQQNLFLEKHFLKISYYTKETQEERDLNSVEKILKDYQKSLKLIYSMYSGHKKGITPQYFDQYAQKGTFISSSGLYRFLKDFGLEDYITLKQTQYLTQKINIENNPNTSDYQILDFDGFIEFVKQASFLMFTRPPKDLRGQPLSMMLEETIGNLKLFASENRINQQIFEDPSNLFFNETQAVAQLNKKLAQNPDYILPEGYKKIVDNKINFQYGIFLEAMSPTYKDVYEVLDQIFHTSLNFHLIQPFMKVEKVTKARPALFVAQRLKASSMPQKHIPIKLKKQIAKIPIKSRPIAMQCAITIDEITQAVELGHTSIGQKHYNKAELQRKKQEQQLKKQYYLEKRRRQSRNRQAKTAISQYKQQRVEKQKQLQLTKKEQEKKIKQQKEKRQREEKQLKRKVEEYNKKKKQQEQQKIRKKKQQEQKERKQRQRLKQLNQQTKKKIEQEKKKKEEQEQKKRQQKEKQNKRLMSLQRKKLAQSQLLKKKMISEYKMKKSGIHDSTLSKNQSEQNKNLENIQDREEEKNS